MDQNSYWAHNGFFGFLNVMKSPKYNPNDPLDRPPFPLIKHEPTFGEVVNSFGRAEIGIIVFGGAVFHCVAYTAAAILTTNLPATMGLSDYFAIRHGLMKHYRRTLLAFLPPLMYLNAMSRLRGGTYNGLEWKTKLNRFAKFDDK